MNTVGVKNRFNIYFYVVMKVPINKKDSDLMKRLAADGKLISKIASEEFPELNYWDVYFEVYGDGERSSLGVKRMITNRLNKLYNDNVDVETRNKLVDEIKDLVWNLYINYLDNQQKLDKIRKVLME